jgi:hypothetical protein
VLAHESAHALELRIVPRPGHVTILRTDGSPDLLERGFPAIQRRVVADLI